MPALAAVTVSATPHAPGGRDCPPRHLSDAPRELGLVAVSRHLKYSALLRSSRGTSTPPVRHRRDIRHRRGAPCRPARTMPLAPCLGPFVVPANCAVSATPPSRTCVRIDRSVVAVPPRRRHACSRRDLYPTSTPSTRLILKRTRGPHAIDACAASRSGFGYVVPRRRRDSGVHVSAVLLVSTSVEVCVAREQAHGPESHRSHRQACRARCYAARWCQRCVPRSLFCCILAAKCFLRFAPREGACSADGLARCGGELYCLHSFEFWAPRLSFDPRCTGQIGKFTGQFRIHGFFLLCIQITLIFSNHLSQHSRLGSMV